MQEIGFFEEAHRHSIAPLILFVLDMHPKSPEICATIRRWFPEATLLPVRNVAKGIAISAPDALPKDRSAQASLDVPFLRLSLRTLIDGQNFRFQSFGEPSQQICRMHWTTNCWTGSRASFFNFGISNSPSGAKTAGHGWPLQHPGAFARLITCSKGMRNRWAAFGVMPNQQPSRKTRSGYLKR